MGVSRTAIVALQTAIAAIKEVVATANLPDLAGLLPGTRKVGDKEEAWQMPSAIQIQRYGGLGLDVNSMANEVANAHAAPDSIKNVLDYNRDLLQYIEKLLEQFGVQ